MTLLRPEARRSRRVVLIRDDAPRALRSALYQLLDADPIVNVVVAARLAAAGSLNRERLGGEIVAVPAGDGLSGACFVGGNLLSIGGEPDAWRALGRHVALGRRTSSSIVGRDDAVAGLWAELRPDWGPARDVRTPQPLLVLDHVPAIPADEQVRRARPEDLDRYLPAAAAMFAEELGISPHVSPGTAAFQARLRHLIADGRAFVTSDFRGQVVFKAEIAAVSAHTAQIQGVWVRPDLRGRGVGTAGLAAVFRHALELAPTVSLYVNGFNSAARRMYRRLGMCHHADLTTILLG